MARRPRPNSSNGDPNMSPIVQRRILPAERKIREAVKAYFNDDTYNNDETSLQKAFDTYLVTLKEQQELITFAQNTFNRYLKRWKRSHNSSPSSTSSTDPSDTISHHQAPTDQRYDSPTPSSASNVEVPTRDSNPQPMRQHSESPTPSGTASIGVSNPREPLLTSDTAPSEIDSRKFICDLRRTSLLKTAAQTLALPPTQAVRTANEKKALLLPKLLPDNRKKLSKLKALIFNYQIAPLTEIIQRYNQKIIWTRRGRKRREERQTNLLAILDAIERAQKGELAYKDILDTTEQLINHISQEPRGFLRRRMEIRSPLEKSLQNWVSDNKDLLLDETTPLKVKLDQQPQTHKSFFAKRREKTLYRYRLPLLSNIINTIHQAEKSNIRYDQIRQAVKITKPSIDKQTWLNKLFSTKHSSLYNHISNWFSQTAPIARNTDVTHLSTTVIEDNSIKDLLTNKSNDFVFGKNYFINETDLYGIIVDDDTNESLSVYLSKAIEKHSPKLLSSQLLQALYNKGEKTQQPNPDFQLNNIVAKYASIVDHIDPYKLTPQQIAEIDFYFLSDADFLNKINRWATTESLIEKLATGYLHHLQDTAKKNTDNKIDSDRLYLEKQLQLLYEVDHTTSCIPQLGKQLSLKIITTLLANFASVLKQRKQEKHFSKADDIYIAAMLLKVAAPIFDSEYLENYLENRLLNQPDEADTLRTLLKSSTVCEFINKLLKHNKHLSAAQLKQIYQLTIDSEATPKYKNQISRKIHEMQVQQFSSSLRLYFYPTSSHSEFFTGLDLPTLNKTLESIIHIDINNVTSLSKAMIAVLEKFELPSKMPLDKNYYHLYQTQHLLNLKFIHLLPTAVQKKLIEYQNQLALFITDAVIETIQHANTIDTLKSVVEKIRVTLQHYPISLSDNLILCINKALKERSKSLLKISLLTVPKTLREAAFRDIDRFLKTPDETLELTDQSHDANDEMRKQKLQLHNTLTLFKSIYSYDLSTPEKLSKTAFDLEEHQQLLTNALVNEANQALIDTPEQEIQSAFCFSLTRINKALRDDNLDNAEIAYYAYSAIHAISASKTNYFTQIRLSIIQYIKDIKSFDDFEERIQHHFLKMFNNNNPDHTAIHLALIARKQELVIEEIFSLLKNKAFEQAASTLTQHLSSNIIMEDNCRLFNAFCAESLDEDTTVDMPIFEKYPRQVDSDADLLNKIPLTNTSVDDYFNAWPFIKKLSDLNWMESKFVCRFKENANQLSADAFDQCLKDKNYTDAVKYFKFTDEINRQQATQLQQKNIQTLLKKVYAHLNNIKCSQTTISDELSGFLLTIRQENEILFSQTLGQLISVSDRSISWNPEKTPFTRSLSMLFSRSNTTPILAPRSVRFSKDS